MSYVYLPEGVVNAWPGLSPAAKAVVVAVASFMNSEATGCFPGVQTISKRAGYKSRRSVEGAISELESRGVLGVVRRPGGSSLYSWQTGETPPQSSAGAQASAHPPAQTSAPNPRKPLRPKDTKKDTSKNPPSGNGAAATKKTKKPSKESSSRPNGGDVWAWWHDANIAAGRRKPVSAGADTKAAKSLADRIQVEELTEAELKACMVLYLEDPDRWLASHGHALRHLPGRINSYLNRIEEQARQDAANSQAALAIEEALEPVGAQQ